MITVDVTPDGYGDCIRLGQQLQQQQPYLVQPMQIKMKFREFVRKLRNKIQQKQKHYNNQDHNDSKKDPPRTTTEWYEHVFDVIYVVFVFSNDKND